MRKRRLDASTLVRYALIQLVELVVLAGVLGVAGRVVPLPAAVFWGILGFWALKDILMFPLVRRAYERQCPAPDGGMIGRCGVALEDLNPRGYVSARGERWQAQVVSRDTAVPRGHPVQVTGIQGLTLMVEPLSGEGEA